MNFLLDLDADYSQALSLILYPFPVEKLLSP